MRSRHLETASPIISTRGEPSERRRRRGAEVPFELGSTVAPGTELHTAVLLSSADRPFIAEREPALKRLPAMPRRQSCSRASRARPLLASMGRTPDGRRGRACAGRDQDPHGRRFEEQTTFSCVPSGSARPSTGWSSPLREREPPDARRDAAWLTIASTELSLTRA